MTVATASFASGYQNSACTTKSHPRLPPGWDFAFGPYYPNTMSQTPTAADVSPSMTVNESSSAYAEDVEAHMFGGAVPDFDAPSGWGDAYPVEEDGTVNFADSTFLARIQQTYPGQTIPVDQAETLASLLGRASGRIFYKEQDALSLSGFFLTEKIFLTCAHLIKPGARDGQERTEEIMRQNNGLVTIGPHRRPWAKSSKNLRAHQLFADNDADYAIFRLDDGQLPRSHDRCLSQHSIQPLQLDQAHAMNDYRLFTIGYNSNIYEKEWDACAARTRELLSSTQRDTLKVMKRGLAEQNPLLSILLPDERSIVLGKFCGGQKSKQQHDRYLHTISGWYGISGSPIACFYSDKGQDAELVVFGLYTGGLEDELGNCMTHFTDEHIKKIRSYCD